MMDYWCWYNLSRTCTQSRDCRLAGRCLDCWNPAEMRAMRGCALWFWLSVTDR